MVALKSSITVGLVTIPIRMEKATDDEDPGKHTVCTGSTAEPHPPARVKAHVDCTVCDKSATSVWGYAERGTEVDGKIVVLTSEEIAEANGTPVKQVQLRLHSREAVYAATVSGDSVQNVTPDKGGEKAYVALRNSLAKHPDVVAVGVWAPKTKNALWVFEVVDSRIVATKRAWPENVRVAPAIPLAEVPAIEQKMMDTVIESYVEDFELLEYVDEAKHGVAALIQSKVGEAVPGAAPVAAASVAVGDMLAALQATLDAAPKKKAAAKKAPAKKTAAKKAAAGRSAA